MHMHTRIPTRTLSLALLSLLQFLIAIDVTVVNVALPAIGDRLDAGPATLSWVVTGYTLVGGGLLLLGGRLTDLLGRRRMFLLGATLFALASLAAGLAPNLETLVAARFAQGAGEALASPAAMSLIALLYPGPEERAKALGVWGAISASGLVVGVLLSDAIVQLLDWRWIFGINVPVVAVVLLATPALVRPDEPRRGPHRLDLPGAALLTAGPLLLVLALIHRHGLGSDLVISFEPVSGRRLGMSRL
jgi:DHA2 family lincomycin resistance protein-like MFS transporter